MLSHVHGPFCSSAPLWLPEVGSVCFGWFEFMDGSSLSENVWSFPASLDCEGPVLRPRLTSARTNRVTSVAPLLSKLASRVRLQISPNKNVNFHCASASSTHGSVGNGFMVPGPLASEFACLIRRFCSSPRSFGGNVASDDSLLAYRAHSQASSPRIVAAPQLPSPCTSS